MSLPKSFNPWNYKPWWCQPWSILLTGILIVSGSWILTKTVWLTVGVSLPILAWWIFFLILWPRLIRESGLFDT
ncbi:MAG: DUF6737 family protein, partial [Microcystaceae cyanobacterium]